MATREEVAQERSDALEELYTEQFDESQQAAIDARADEPDTAETEEEYYYRIANVPGIFGDTDTAIVQDVPSKNNEVATVAVAEADAAAVEGDDEAGDLSTDEARRQVDVSAEGQPDAEEVNEGDEDSEEDENGETEVPATEVVAADDEDAEQS